MYNLYLLMVGIVCKGKVKIKYITLHINDFRLCLNETESGHFADDTFIQGVSKLLEPIFNN